MQQRGEEEEEVLVLLVLMPCSMAAKWSSDISWCWNAERVFNHVQWLVWGGSAGLTTN